MRILVVLVGALAVAGCNQTAEDPTARAARVNAWQANQRAMNGNAPQTVNVNICNAPGQVNTCIYR